MSKLKLFAVSLFSACVVQANAESNLATWDFESGYDHVIEGNVITHIPNAAGWEASDHFWFKDYTPRILPNTFTGNQEDYVMTCYAKNRYYDFRLLFTDSHVLAIENKKSGSENDLNSSTDFSTGLNAYFEAEFPTKGYYKVGATIALSCYDGVTDLEVVYSVDGGNTWSDAGTYTSSSNFYIPNETKITLLDADDKDNVIVRILPGNGMKTYWYLDKLSIDAETEPVAKHTIKYIDCHGAEIGTQQVFHNSTIGRFHFDAADANVDEGYTFRGWYSSSTGGTHHYNTDVISQDVTFYAYQTATETNDIGTTWSYQLQSENQDYDNLHDNFELIDAVWGNAHGPYSQELILNVGAEAVISIGTCTYSASVYGVGEFTITDPEGSVVGKMLSKAPKGEEGKIVDYLYSGKPGRINLKCNASYAFYHSIGISNLDSVKIGLDAAGYGMYYSAASLIVPEGVNIGVVTEIGEGTVTVDYSVYKPGDVIRALTPFIVKGTPGDVKFMLSATEGAIPATNLLGGVLYDEEKATGGSYFYTISESEGKPVFTLAAGKGRTYVPGAHGAYLATSEAIADADAQVVEVGLAETPTGIASVPAPVKETGIMYNIHGQRVNSGYKGVVIMNGRKFMK